jgi:ubiquinone/menaquinone biosynthesis C-methylase UbiE
MYEDGYLSISNVDISRTVIDGMASRHRDKKGCSWQVMNVASLAHPDMTFDAVVDKGTLDSVLCGDNSTANAARYCSETARVLKPSGVFFVISYGIPENR